jgi:hypothetical protein
MEKLAVGMYCRIDGRINKIIEIDTYENIGATEREQDDNRFDFPKNKKCIGLEIGFSCFKEDITKSSFNLIDLIEENDYVNGRKVWEDNNHLFIAGNGCYLWLGRDILEENIKEVLTKQQYENNVYKIKE